MSEQEITQIKINMTELSSDLKYIKETLVAHIQKEDEHLEKFIKALDNFTEKSEQKFAGKWLEVLVVRLGWIIVTPIMGGACYGIWQLIQHLAIN